MVWLRFSAKRTVIVVAPNEARFYPSSLTALDGKGAGPASLAPLLLKYPAIAFRRPPVDFSGRPLSHTQLKSAPVRAVKTVHRAIAVKRGYLRRYGRIGLIAIARDMAAAVIIAAIVAAIIAAVVVAVLVGTLRVFHAAAYYGAAWPTLRQSWRCKADRNRAKHC